MDLRSTDQDEHADMVLEWIDAWTDLTGQPPDNFFLPLVMEEVEKSSQAARALTRIRTAALLAAYHRSWTLHHGLRANELEALGVSAARQTAIGVWNRCS